MCRSHTCRRTFRACRSYGGRRRVAWTCSRRRAWTRCAAARICMSAPATTTCACSAPCVPPPQTASSATAASAAICWARFLTRSFAWQRTKAWFRARRILQVRVVLGTRNGNENGLAATARPFLFSVGDRLGQRHVLQRERHLEADRALAEEHELARLALAGLRPV